MRHFFQIRSIVFAAVSSASTIAWICSGRAARPRRRKRVAARRFIMARMTERRFRHLPVLKEASERLTPALHLMG